MIHGHGILAAAAASKSKKVFEAVVNRLFEIFQEEKVRSYDLVWTFVSLWTDGHRSSFSRVRCEKCVKIHQLFEWNILDLNLELSKGLLFLSPVSALTREDSPTKGFLYDRPQCTV